MKRNQKTLTIILSSLLILHIFMVIPSIAITPSSSDISPSIFSPGDGNGLNDTTTITITFTSSQTLYVNIFNDQSELIAEDRVMAESPSGTYKYTWNGKNESDGYVSEGTYTIRVSDNPAQNGDTIGTVEVDTTPPSSQSLSINGGTTYTTSRYVNLTIGATGATKMKVSNYLNFSGATWETYSTSKTNWALSSSSGDGVTQTVYINFRDVAGANVSTYDSIELDTVAPDASLSINSGNSSTNDLNVTLTITASDATHMKIDNDTNFFNMTSWITKANTYDFTLPSGADGSKTVYLRVKDSASNVYTTSDSITVDTQVPTNLSLSVNNGASYTNITNVTLTLSASGGPSKVYISNDGSNWTQYNYTTSLSWVLTSSEGTKYVYYKAADGAGNNATAISATIALDTTAPSAVTLSSPADGATVTTQTPTFSWSDPNTQGTKNFYITISQSGNVVDSGTLNSSTKTYTSGTLSAGTYSWKVKVFDMANNSAVTSQRSFTISVSGLAIPSPQYPTSEAYVNDTTPRLRWSQVTGAGTINYDYKYGNSSTNLTNTGSTTSLYADTVDYNHGDTVYWSVRARNTTHQSNYSSVRSFTIDTQPPTSLSISVNSGASYATSTSVTLTLSATGATYMMISNNTNFSGASWESYATTKSWTLSSTDDTKTVYFKAKDNAVGDQGSTAYANIASAVSDTIILDTSAPTVTPQSPSSGSTITTTNPTIRATLSDTGSGINTSAVTMTLDGASVTPTNITEALVRYVSSTISTGLHSVSVAATDYAGYTGYGNWTFTISSGGGGSPSPGGTPGVIPATYSSSISVSHEPTTITNSDTVNISVVLSAFSADVISVDLFWNDGIDHSKQMTLQTGTTYSATLGPFPEGITVTYYALVLDNDSQETSSSTFSFTIEDYNGPTISIVSPADGSKITDRTPTIKATYSDTGGIDTSSVKLTFNDDVTSNAIITATTVTYVPSNPLSYSTHTVTLEVADNLGNTATKTWSFTISPEEIEITKLIDEIVKGESETISLKDYNIVLEEIKITAANNLENVTLNIKTLEEKPTNAIAPSKTVYMYIDIEINTEATDLSLVTITFKVEQSWFEDNHIDKKTVMLLRYHNNSWQEFTTTKTDEDDLYVYYEVEIPGFSTFAIVGSEISGKDIAEVPLTWVIAIVGIIAVIIIFIIILFKKGYIYIEEEHKDEP